MVSIIQMLRRKRVSFSDEESDPEYHMAKTGLPWTKTLGLILLLLISIFVFYKSENEGKQWKPQRSGLLNNIGSSNLPPVLAPDAEEYSSVFSVPGRIVAIGDLHGDLENARLVLKAAHVIDDHDEWIAGNDTLVQLGDMVDRGLHSIEIVKLFMKLQYQASNSGGRVINLLGNHEILNFMGDYFYVNTDEMKRLGVIRWKTLFSSFSDVGRWLMNRPTIVKVRDTVFVHAGLRPTMAMTDIDLINKRVNSGLLMGKYDDPLFLDEGPHWTRIFANWGPGLHQRCELVEKTLNILGAKRMVIGHNVQLLTGIPDIACGRKLFVIDSGISKFYGGNKYGLEISAQDEEKVFTVAR